MNVCAPLTEKSLPATRITYVTHVETLAKQVRPRDGARVLLGCNEIEDVALTRMAEITLAQDWFLQTLARGDVSTIVSLAPAEELAIRVVRSQRSKLDTKTMQSKEGVRSIESQISDKEMLDVARTMTRNEQWQLSATAGINAGTAGAQASVGYQQSVQVQTSAKMQQIRESTQRASNELRSLSKLEVTQSKSSEVTDERIRKLVNPYRDRSLILTIFELNKIYCVKHSVAKVEPVLAFRAPQIKLDRDFVFRNGDFLALALLDRPLAGELSTALEYNVSPDALGSTRDKLDRVTHEAIQHLLFSRDVHLSPSDPTSIVDSAVDSFDYARYPSAYSEAYDIDYANELMYLLGSFRKMVLDARFDARELSDDEAIYNRVALVIAFANDVAALWELVDTAHKWQFFDNEHHTAVIRRLPAFLTLVEQVIKPMHKGSSVSEQSRRVETVLRRVLAHLACFRSYYTEAFHRYLYELTNRAAHVEMVRDAIVNQLDLATTEREAILDNFDIERLVLSGSILYIPYVGDAARDQLAKWFPGDSFDEGEPVRDTVVVPADGASVEPSAGRCVLSGVPPAPPPVTP